MRINYFLSRPASCSYGLSIMIVRRAWEAGKPPVILCDGNDTEAAELSRLLAPHYELSLASAPMDALKNLVNASFRSIVVSLQPGDPSFLELIPVVKKLRPKLPIIVIADGSSLEEQRSVQRQGIFYFVPRPVASREILTALANAVARGLER